MWRSIASKTRELPLKDYALSFALALAASVPFTLGVRRWALWRGWVAKPRPDRWHRRPTALFGGVAIFGAFLLSYLLRRPADLAGDALIASCASGMFLLGLVDDFVPLKPYAKLVGQILISIALTVGGMRLHFLRVEVLDQALSIFWLVAITNAFNLLDNLDGLAGGVAVIAGGFLVYFCHAAGQSHAAQLSAALCGAALGFLVFNVNPASIFMGDCGSLFMGFILGSMGMVTTAPGIRRNVLAMLAVPVLVLLIPIVDTMLVTLSRSMHGRPVSQGGRDHTSHRLVALGFSERKAAALLWGGSLAAALLAVALQQLAPPMTVFLIVASLLVLAFFGLFIGRVKVYEPIADGSRRQGRAMLPTLAGFAYKRRIFEVLCDVTLIFTAYYGAFLLRYEGSLAEPHYGWLRDTLPLVIAVQMSMLLLMGLYKGLWRYTSVNDVGLMVKTVGAAWMVGLLALVLVFGLHRVSWSVVIIDGVLLLLGISGSRLAVRLIRHRLVRTSKPLEARRVLIYGAGDMGEIILRMIVSQRDLGLVPVGFLDDDPEKHGRVIHGLRVIGPIERLNDAAVREGVEEIALADEQAAPERLALLCEIMKNAGLRSRKLSFSLEALPEAPSAAAQA